MGDQFLKYAIHYRSTTVHGTIAAVGEDLCQAKEGGISKGNGSNRDHGGSRHNNPGCQSPLNLLFHNGRTETTNE